MSYISLRNIRKIYMEGMENQVNALDGVDLDIDLGEFVAIVGASGSGKSTMMNILGCLDIPTYGTYTLGGSPVENMTEKDLARIRSLQIGFIFQGYNLIPALTVEENVALPLVYQGIDKEERIKRAKSVLKKVEIESKAKNRPSQLSGGQQQRVAIARAMATKSPIIMADEPTGALDSKTGVQVLNLLKELNELGTTIILITHDLKIAESAKRVITVKDGKIVSDVVNKTSSSNLEGGKR